MDNSTQQSESDGGTPSPERLGSAVDGPHSLTDKIGVCGHVAAWDKTRNAKKAKEAKAVSTHKYTRGPANNLYVYG